ncbi:hypothetical protein QZH41_012790 [Actinostola sp. cb2023]|nr:hypothetical protein QZH41_012790 [Actinostola sp. cb2023]
MKKNKDAEQTLMNIHNAEAGRTAVRDQMEILCKCHGVSGACQTKTCYRRLSDFRKVATFLRRKYDRVVYVKNYKGKNRKNDAVTTRQKRIDLRSKNRRKKYTTKDLIALSKSPNYCKRSIGRGSYGTKGRICNPKIRRGKGGCNYMCCGRGHRTKPVIKVERCECRYVWCCYVKCNKCKKRELVSRCK